MHTHSFLHAPDHLLAACSFVTGGRRWVGISGPILGSTSVAGIGRSIFEACAQQSKEFGVVEFECCSSLVAEGFYARLGLQTIETKELTLKEGVPPIPCKIMKTRDTSL